MVKPKSGQGRHQQQKRRDRAGQSVATHGTNSVADLSEEQLLQKASESENRFEFTEALQCYNKVLKRLEQAGESGLDNPNPKRITALRSSAYVLLELGRLEAAKKRFTEVLSLTPDPGYETYMYLGQLHEGTKSLEFYRLGIEAISKHSNEQTSTTCSERSAQSLSRAESSAYCAIAELYMTDLCDLEEAQSECQKAFEAATHIDPSNPQAWLTAANFYTVVANAQAARDAVDHCLNLWWDKLESALDETGENRGADVMKDTVEKEDENIDVEELTGIPSSGLIALVRMMLELEMNEKASTILQSLLEGEEEDNLEVHYLLTVVGRKLWQAEDPHLLAHYATTTKVIAAKLGDLEMVQEMTSLLAELPEPDAGQDALSISSTSDEDEVDDTG